MLSRLTFNVVITLLAILRRFEKCEVQDENWFTLSSYIMGESGRKFSKHLKEHLKVIDKIGCSNFSQNSQYANTKHSCEHLYFHHYQR